MLRMIFSGLVAILLAAQVHAAPLLINGSFEDMPEMHGGKNDRAFSRMSFGHGADWGVQSALPGWSTLRGNGPKLLSNKSFGFLDADDGEHYVELDNNGNSGIFQDVVLEAGRYELGFSYRPRSRIARSNPIHYSVGNLIDDMVVGPGRGSFPRGQWTRVRAPFDVVTPGMYRITFAAGGTSDGFGGLLDRVSLTAEQADDIPIGIPLPAPIVLLAGAVGGLFSMRRKFAVDRG